mgnify:FL=1
MLDKIFGDEKELPIVKAYEAAQNVVSKFLDKEHKSIEFLASKLGTTKGYLYANLDPAQMNKPLSIDKAYNISKEANDVEIFETILCDLGYVVTPKQQAKISDSSMRDTATDAQMECNDVFASVMNSLKDGKVTKEEQARNKKEIHEAIKKLTELNNLNDGIELEN